MHRDCHTDAFAQVSDVAQQRLARRVAAFVFLAVVSVVVVLVL